MAEVKDLERAAPAQEPAPETPAQSAPKESVKSKWKNMPRKKRRKIIRWGVLLVLLAPLILLAQTSQLVLIMLLVLLAVAVVLILCLLLRTIDLAV